MSSGMKPAYVEEVEDDSDEIVPHSRVIASAPRSPPQPESRKSNSSPQLPKSDQTRDPSRDHGQDGGVEIEPVLRPSRRDSRASKRDRDIPREQSYERHRDQSYDYSHDQSRESRDREKKREQRRRPSMHRSNREHRNSMSFPEDAPYDQMSRGSRTPFSQSVQSSYPPPPINTNYYSGHPNLQMMPPPQSAMFPPASMNMGPGSMPPMTPMTPMTPMSGPLNVPMNLPMNGNMNGSMGGPMGGPMGSHMGGPGMAPPMHMQGPHMMPQMSGGHGGYNSYLPPANNYAIQQQQQQQPLQLQHNSQQPQLPPAPSQDYHDSQSHRMNQRFPPARPMSVQPTVRESQSRHYDYDHNYDDDLSHSSQQVVTTRRPSIRKRDTDDDRKRFIEDDKRKLIMAAKTPQRPKSARPVSAAYARPPPERSHMNKRLSMCDDEFDYEAARPHTPEYDDYIPQTGSRPRHNSVTHGTSRPPPAHRRRPSSYYQEGSGSYNGSYGQDMYHLSNDMKALAVTALTSDALQKVNRANKAPSSHSTWSGGSRGDDSERRQPSVTTHTTRSSNDEEVTIKVQGDAIVNISGRDIKCRDGTELTLTSSGPFAIRTAGDRHVIDQGGYYNDDRIVRSERVMHRNRANSQATSYGRGSVDRHYDAPIQHYPDRY